MNNNTKNLILILMFILPSVGFSQRNGSKVLDFNKIDYRLLDSLIIVEINSIRDSFDYNTMSYSRVVSDNLSKKQTERLAYEQKVYHPDRKHLYNEKWESEVVKSVKKGYPNNSVSNYISSATEICLFKSVNVNSVSYGEMATRIVDLWESSPDHRPIIRTYAKEFETNGVKYILMTGVSTKYGVYNGNKGFYATLHITTTFVRD